jgi:hypothetical protein
VCIYRVDNNIKAALGGTVRMETPVIYFYALARVEDRSRGSFPAAADHGVVRTR